MSVSHFLMQVKAQTVGFSNNDRLRVAIDCIRKEGADIEISPVIATHWPKLLFRSKACNRLWQQAHHGFDASPLAMIAELLNISRETACILTGARISVPVTDEQTDAYPDDVDSCLASYGKSYIFVTADEVISQLKDLIRLGERNYQQMFVMKAKQKIHPDFSFDWF